MFATSNHAYPGPSISENAHPQHCVAMKNRSSPEQTSALGGMTQGEIILR
jgi:hypothetical protein